MAFSGSETTRLIVTATPGRPQTFSAKGAAPAVATTKTRLLLVLGVGA